MRFIGLDCHSNNFRYFILGEKGDKGPQGTITFQTNGFERWLSQLTKEDYVAIEVSTNTFAVYDILKPLVKECHILDPRKLREIHQAAVKTDKFDAYKIASRLRYAILTDSKKEEFPTVFVPDQTIRKLRRLFSSLRMLKEDAAAFKNKIHSITKYENICIPKQLVNRVKFRELIKGFGLSEIALNQINCFLNVLDTIKNEIKSLEEQIILTSEPIKEEVKIITSVQGISLLGAIGMMSDIADIKRFETSRKLCNYLRTAPKIDSSNDKTIIKSVNKQSRKLSLHFLIQGFPHIKKNSQHYLSFYERKINGKSAGKVRIAICRKLITAIYYMLTRKEYYNCRNEDNHNRKLKQYENILKKIA